MSEINANIVINPYDIAIQQQNNQVNVEIDPIDLTVYASGFAQPEGNAGQLQYNYNGQQFAGAANTDCSDGNVTFNNISNLKIAGGNSGYYLQTDGNGILTWANGTANVTGNGTAAGGNNAVQLSNGSGNFKVGAGFVFDPASNVLTVPGNVAASNGVFSANVIANNITANGNITANNFTGNTFTGNFVGIISNANYSTYSGTVLTNAQPNITSLGNLTDLVLNGKIHLGQNAGYSNQQSYAIAIGAYAGYANADQYSISIGSFAQENNAPQHSIALGYGTIVTVANGIAIGRSARSGANSIGIGANANAYDNCIVLNATGNYLNAAAVANTFYVKPIRNSTSGNLLFYDSATGEITYSTSISGSSISNGTSNVNIPSANGNVLIGVGGTANVVIITGTSVNVTGRIFSSGNITATQFISNVATGTPPFVVTSTTQVANLNVANANYAAYAGIVSTANYATNANSATYAGMLTANLSGGNIDFTGANIVFTNTLIADKVVRTYGYSTVALLGNAGAVNSGAGARSFVYDSNVVADGNFGKLVYGNGSNKVPVYSDGTNWRIG